MTRAIITQLVDALNKCRDWPGAHDECSAAILAAREYLATEPIDERAELISDLLRIADEGMADYANTGYPNSNAIKKAADMLEADGKQKETKNEQQVRSEVDAMGGRQPMEVSGDCSRDNFNGDDRALVASMVALLKLDAAGCLVPHGIGGYARKLLQASITRLEADALQIEDLESDKGFYQRRVKLLQQWQSKMRDPERTIACDIIANGKTLPPENAGDRYKITSDAQQAKRVPMTDAEAHQTLLDMAANIEKFGDGTESNEQLSSECIRFILERVDHHKILPAGKPTGWDNGLSQDYCAEFGQWLASQPGARQQIKEMFDEPEEEDLYALALKADNWGQP